MYKIVKPPKIIQIVSTDITIISYKYSRTNQQINNLSLSTVCSPGNKGNSGCFVIFG